MRTDSPKHQNTSLYSCLLGAAAGVSIILGGAALNAEPLSQSEVTLFKSLIGDHQIAGGTRTSAGLSSGGHAITNEALKRLILEVLEPYKVVDETVLTDKQGAKLYRFNTSDLSCLKPERAKQPTVCIIGDPTYTNSFVVQLSEEDRKKLGRPPQATSIRGTYQTNVRKLSEDEITTCTNVLADPGIAYGYCNAVTLTGVNSPAERALVLELLATYAGDPVTSALKTRDETVLMDKHGAYRSRLKTSDLSKLSPSAVQQYPWVW
jgi:hypothetical protein